MGVLSTCSLPAVFECASQSSAAQQNSLIASRYPKSCLYERENVHHKIDVLEQEHGQDERGEN